MSELQHWVWLSERLAVRPRRKLELLEAFGDVRQVYFAQEDDYCAMLPGLTPSELRDLADKDLAGANHALEKLEMNYLSMITIRDAAYPERLRQISAKSSPAAAFWSPGSRTASTPRPRAGLCVRMVFALVFWVARSMRRLPNTFSGTFPA